MRFNVFNDTTLNLTYLLWLTFDFKLTLVSGLFYAKRGKMLLQQKFAGDDWSVLGGLTFFG